MDVEWLSLTMVWKVHRWPIAIIIILILGVLIKSYKMTTVVVA